MIRKPTTLTLVLSVLTVVALVTGCQKQEPETVTLNRVENSEMGIAIADLSSAFRVVATEPTRIGLELIEGEGKLEIISLEEEKSINIVAAVKDHQADIEGRPGGEYKGGREITLVSIPGAVYYSRGRFDGDQGRVEETVMLMIHPWKDRQLRAIYTYPAGEDSPQRLQDHLFAVVAELEGLPEPDLEAAEPEGEAASAEG